MTNEVKIWKISGKYIKIHQRHNFTKYVRATKKADALEKALSLITSQRVIRRKIDIPGVETVEIENCPDLYMTELAKLE